MNLKEALLAAYDAEWLMNFAKNAGLKDLKTPEETAEAISETLLDPQIMKQNMMTLHEEDIDFIRYCLKQEKPFLPNTVYYGSADRLRDLHYGFVTDEKMDFMMPDDVKEVFQTVDTPEFQYKRERTAWLNDCVSLIPYLYAILSTADLCTLYRKHRGFDESNEEIIMNMLGPLSKTPHFPCVLKGNELITKDLEDTDQEKRLREIHETLPVVFPSYGEIRDLVQNGYPSRDQSWKKVKHYLIHELHVSDSFSDPLLNGIWMYIATGNAFTDVLKMVREESVPVRKEQERSFCDVLSDAWNHTRMIMCNGDTPLHTMPYADYIFKDN